MNPYIHAPDAGLGIHTLCENPSGDITHWLPDVTCPDCLDWLEEEGLL